MDPRTRLPVENRIYIPAPGEETDVELLPAGDVTNGVVRVGGTVRRPHQLQSHAVADYLDWLEDAGFEGSPRFLGRDSAGRDVLTFLPGTCAGAVPEQWAQSEDLLRSVTRLLRRLHAASAGYTPARHPFPPRPVRQDPGRLVCHLDVTPQNVVVRGGLATGLIDFDLAGPSTALKDSFNTAMHWVPLRDPADAWAGWETADPFRRLRIFADAYGWTLEERRRLPQFGAEAAALSLERMEHNARNLGGGWARMWRGGVGEVISRRRQWLEDNEASLTAALTDLGFR
ncbi:aminoglycoside phosphotransferase family protein [Arthrobacter sp. FW305-BF8]|uniref:phosphotransferase n=1 Tax=Arthrobacter sp. FW305-BF8 TaxID=2879617 RepID=UPI001F15B055|nr:phosphotransferase [Arthrobacter sp. FW305-BF8]UKA54704.1 aminoglycoside phosphotransferase family protein [Arthrobacter sp. FW305-BF8]